MCAILHHGFPVAEDVSCPIEAYTAGVDQSQECHSTYGRWDGIQVYCLGETIYYVHRLGLKTHASKRDSFYTRIWANRHCKRTVFWRCSSGELSHCGLCMAFIQFGVHYWWENTSFEINYNKLCEWNSFVDSVSMNSTAFEGKMFQILIAFLFQSPHITMWFKLYEQLNLF